MYMYIHTCMLKLRNYASKSKLSHASRGHRYLYTSTIRGIQTFFNGKLSSVTVKVYALTRCDCQHQSSTIMTAQPVKLDKWQSSHLQGSLIIHVSHIVPQSTVLALHVHVVHINAHFADFGSLLQTFAYTWLHVSCSVYSTYLQVIADAFIVSQTVLIPPYPEPIMILIYRYILHSTSNCIWCS